MVANGVTHRIKRQIVALEVAGRDRGRVLARELQERTSRVHRERLVAIIADQCDRASPPDRADRLDRIDRIEVDLGEIPASEFEDELARRLTHALAEALQREIAATRAMDRMRGERAGEGVAQDTGQTRSALELFEVFMRTGSLPWWAEIRQPRLLERTLRRLVRDVPSRLVALMDELAGVSVALERIAMVYNDGLLAVLFGLLAPARRIPGAAAMLAGQSSGVLGKELVHRLQRRADLLGPSSGRLRIVAWQSALHVAAWGRRETLAGLCKEILVVLAIHLKMTYRGLLTGLHRAEQAVASGPRGVLGGVIERLHDELPGTGRLVRGQRDAESRMESASAPELASASASESALESALASRLSSRIVHQSSVISTFTASEEVYIENAGLVLLWPFFGHLFEHLDLLRDGEFGDPAAQHRAVRLLHYLVTEQPSPLEYWLSLDKLFCGLELTDVVDIGPPVSDTEAQECDHLLSAAIDHAPILNNLSNAGFRATFLVRLGVLSARDGAWLVQVTRETYDVVLDHLPWSFDWIKLPWMQTPVRVEWT